MSTVLLLQGLAREVQDWALDTFGLCLAGGGGCRSGAWAASAGVDPQHVCQGFRHLFRGVQTGVKGKQEWHSGSWLGWLDEGW